MDTSKCLASFYHLIPTQDILYMQVTDEEGLPLIYDLLKQEGFCMGGSTAINIGGKLFYPNLNSSCLHPTAHQLVCHLIMHTL